MDSVFLPAASDPVLPGYLWGERHIIASRQVHYRQFCAIPMMDKWCARNPPFQRQENDDGCGCARDWRSLRRRSATGKGSLRGKSLVQFPRIDPSSSRSIAGDTLRSCTLKQCSCSQENKASRGFVVCPQRTDQKVVVVSYVVRDELIAATTDSKWSESAFSRHEDCVPCWCQCWCNTPGALTMSQGDYLKSPAEP